MQLKSRHAGRVTALVCVLAIGLALPTVAAAQPVTSTVHETGTETRQVDFPCLSSGTLTLNFHIVEHTTDFHNGVFHFATTERGTATFTAADGTVYSGHYTQHLDIQSPPAPNVFATTGTVHFTLRSSDGSRLRVTGVDHTQGSASGIERHFERFTSSC